MKENLYCLIMAGGSGTRFWPRSRRTKPKQYLDMFGEGSLLSSTIKRFSAFTETENIFVVSHNGQAAELEKQTPMLPRENLIYEPVGKNTLPCIGLAALFVEEKDPEGIMVISPADHLVTGHKLFRDTVLEASKMAREREGIVTIGIPPTHPATGYGYVKTAEGISGSGAIGTYKVDRFVEKPGIEKAKTYMNDQRYFWNSGLFIFKVSVFFDAVREFSPALYSDLRKIQAAMGKPTFGETLNDIYRKVESISIDYGIMEHARNIFMTEGNFGWNDLGSWESVFQQEKKDENGNVSRGEAIFLDAGNSYVFSDEGLVALVGLDDVVVVREGNATLVCRKSKAQDVKKIVDQLKAENKNHFL